MTITLTSITKSQWGKVVTVALWVVLTNGIGILTAWLTAKPELLAVGPGLNVLGKAIQQIFQTEEDQAVNELPAQIVRPADQVIAAANNGIAHVAPGLAFTPADKTPPSPNIG